MIFLAISYSILMCVVIFLFILLLFSMELRTMVLTINWSMTIEMTKQLYLMSLFNYIDIIIQYIVDIIVMMVLFLLWQLLLFLLLSWYDGIVIEVLLLKISVVVLIFVSNSIVQCILCYWHSNYKFWLLSIVIRVLFILTVIDSDIVDIGGTTNDVWYSDHSYTFKLSTFAYIHSIWYCSIRYSVYDIRFWRNWILFDCPFPIFTISIVLVDHSCHDLILTVYWYSYSIHLFDIPQYSVFSDDRCINQFHSIFNIIINK